MLELYVVLPERVRKTLPEGGYQVFIQQKQRALAEVFLGGALVALLISPQPSPIPSESTRIRVRKIRTRAGPGPLRALVVLSAWVFGRKVNTWGEG